MALKVGLAAGSSPTATAPVDQVLDDSGFGQPDCAIYFQARNADSYGSLTLASRLGIGFTDGTNQHVSSISARHNIATSNCSRRYATDEVFMRLKATGTGNIDSEANWKEWNTDGSDVTWDVTEANARLVSATYFRNNSQTLTAKVGTFTSSGTQNGTVDVTALGKSADIVFISSIQYATADTGTTDAVITLGCYVKGQGQGSVNYFQLDAASISNVRGFLDTGNVLRELTSSSTGAGLLISDHASGFTVATKDAGTAILCGYLAINVGQEFDAWLDTFIVESSSGNDATTGLGFSPKYLLSLITQITAADTETTDDTAGTVGFGTVIGTAAADQFCGSINSDDADLANTDERSIVEQGIWTGRLNSGTDIHTGKVSSLDSDGWTTNWSPVSVARGLSIGIAIGTSYVDLDIAFSGAATLDSPFTRVTPIGEVVSFSGAGTFVAAMGAVSDLDIAFAGAGTFNAPAYLYKNLAIAYDGVGTLTTIMGAVSDLDIAFTGAGTFDPTPNYYIGLPVAFVGVGTFDAIVTIGGEVDLAIAFSGAGSFDAPLKPFLSFPVAFTGASTLTPGLNYIQNTSIAYTGSGTLTPGLNYIQNTSIAYTGTGTLSPKLNYIQNTNISFLATSSFDSVISRTRNLIVSFTAAGDLTTLLTRRRALFVLFEGHGNFDPGDLVGGTEVPPNQYERIQNELITQAKAGLFYLITHNADTQLADVSDSTTTPAEVIARETSSSFDQPLRNRISYKLERKDWKWQLAIRFNSPASVEFFEDALTSSPPVIPRTSNLKQIRLELQTVQAFHPEQQQPARGTRAVLNFIARQTPV